MRIRVQQAKESFLSRLKAEREGNAGKPAVPSQPVNLHKQNWKSQDESKISEKPLQKNRAPHFQPEVQDYNPMQMFKNFRNQNGAQPGPTVDSAPHHARGSKISFTAEEPANSSPPMKAGLKRFGGTKAAAPKDKKEDSDEDGDGNLMSKLEKFSGMWNDLDEAPVLVDTQRKTLLPPALSDGT